MGRAGFSYNVYFPLVSYVQTVCQVCGLDAMKAETWNSCEPKFLRILWAEVASFSHSSFVWNQFFVGSVLRCLEHRLGIYLSETVDDFVWCILQRIWTEEILFMCICMQALGGNERIASKMLYSSKQHVFLIFFECRGATSEVVLYRDNLGALTVNERVNTVTGTNLS